MLAFFGHLVDRHFLKCFLQCSFKGFCPDTDVSLVNLLTPAGATIAASDPHGGTVAASDSQGSAGRGISSNLRETGGAAEAAYVLVWPSRPLSHQLGSVSELGFEAYPMTEPGPQEEVSLFARVVCLCFLALPDSAASLNLQICASASILQQGFNKFILLCCNLLAS